MGVDDDTELKSTSEINKHRTYVLPDENIITVGDTFPLRGSVVPASFIGQSNMKCDVYIRKESHAYAVLPSGTNMFPEIFHRMTKEPTALSPSTMKIEVVAPQE